MSDEKLCLYSVVRYVADPRREEAKNIGVIVVCPEVNFADARFQVSKAGVSAGSPRAAILRELERSIRQELDTVCANGRLLWSPEHLDDLYRSASNLVQFSRPLPYIGDPTSVLGEVYREFVQPRNAGGGAHWTRGKVNRIFTKAFEKHNVEKCLRPEARIETDGAEYTFDLGVKNGRWRYVVETLSFQNQDLQRVEETGGWLSHVWPEVSEATGAGAFLIAEPPATEEERDATRRFKKIARWVQDAKITLVTPSDAPKLADELARELAGEHR